MATKPKAAKTATRKDSERLAAFRGDERALTPDEERKRLVDWYDAYMLASYWFGLAKVKPAEAAQLLSRYEPHSPGSAHWLAEDGRSTPGAKRKLLRGFEDADSERPLREWLQLAKNRDWSYDPWIDKYVAAAGNSALVPAQVESTIDRKKRRLERLQSLGGVLERSGSTWRLKGVRGALAKLVKEEALAGRPRSKRQDVTRDLHEAAKAEANADLIADPLHS